MTKSAAKSAASKRPLAAGEALRARILGDLPPNAELDQRETEMLEQACHVADDLASLEEAMRVHGVTSSTSGGRLIVSPLVVEARQQRLTLMRLLGSIGLDAPAEASSSPASSRASRAANARRGRG
jgi:uncharacterized protein with von Willebrand factor type A (vWA) domain